RIQHVLVAEGLGQELDGSRFHGTHGHGNIAMRSDEDDRNGNVALSQFTLKVKSAFPGQPDIENKAARYIRLHLLQKFEWGAEAVDVETYRADQEPKSIPDGDIAVQDEYCRRPPRHNRHPRIAR